MDPKWQRQRLNQVSGAALVLDSLVINQSELFTQEERVAILVVSELLKQKGNALRGGSPGGG